MDRQQKGASAKRAGKDQKMNRKISIMIVEDEDAPAGEICSFLGKWGYEAWKAKNFQDILREFMAGRPQLVLMDINLPSYDGFYWCRQIREHSKAPILYISSRGEDYDKIMAIAQGGDDYLEKPFHLELLKAKIEAILRRTYEYQVKERIYLNEELSFDPESELLYCREQELELTKSERRILSKLVEKRTEVVSREELMMALWNTDEYVSDGALTTIISRFKSKLKGACGEEIIVTKKGQGYWIL